MRFRSKKVMMFIVLLFIAGGTLFVQMCNPKSADGKEYGKENSYIGDQSCKSCHKNEYSDWSHSDHFKAMQPANDSTVLGNFNSVSYSADGITSRFFKKNGKFFINTQGEDGNNHDYEIKYTFGYFPLQQYLIEFPTGRMQVTRQSWDSRDKKWFHQYPGQKIPSHDWLHWTGNAQNWNTTCARCHSTNLQKNYDFASDSYHTTFSVLTVSCESCHGPAKLHVDYVNSAAYKKGNRVRGSYMLLAKNSGQTTEINTCTPCHVRAVELTRQTPTSDELLDNYIPEIPSSEYFYPDGQVKDEDYTYTSFLQSKMYSRGIKCSNCHNPHSGKILFTNNTLCMQCHAKKYDEPSHTFHTAGTEASLCKNCHMPGTYYMGNDFRHDHGLRVPRPDLSVKYGTPNACNKCHTNKSAAWAAASVNEWYGPKRAYHFSEDLIPASKGNAESETHILRLFNDTATPAIIRATALHYLKDHITPTASELLKRGLSDKDAQVRYRSLVSFQSFPPETWINSVGPLLTDRVRAVRIAAADLLITVPSNQIPQEYYSAFTNAKAELQDYVLLQSDFAGGNIMAGDYYMKQQDYSNAELYYLRGLKKDSALNYARLNLSVVYNVTGRNTEAVKTLQEALKTDPKNDRIYFNLALVYNEMNNRKGAEDCLAKAVDLHSQNPRVYYNYGLMLQQNGSIQKAVAMFNKGIELSPQDGDLNYALAVLYLQNNQVDKARVIASNLKRYYPSNPNYIGLYRQLGL